MLQIKYSQNMSGILLILVVALLSACSMAPTRESDSGESGNSYDQLYRGSSENKTANEAAIAAETPEEAITRGDEAYNKGQYDIALYEYVEALKLNGGDSDTLNKVGDIHYTLEDYESAAGAYNASIQLGEKNQHALLGLGLIQLRTRKYDEAKSSLSGALELNPEIWLAHNGLGTIADIQGDYSNAIQHYRSALGLSPYSTQVLNNLGYSEYLSGNWNAALTHFIRAVNTDPDFDRAWYNIGLIYSRMGRYEDAFDAFRNVLDPPQAYNDIGYLCMTDGYYNIAEKYFQKAIKTSPSYYLKAHENLERLERLKERGPAQGKRTSSGSTPAGQANNTQAKSHDSTVDISVTDAPVMITAPVSSKAGIDITPRNKSAKSSSRSLSPYQANQTEVRQSSTSATAVSQLPDKSPESHSTDTQPKSAANTVTKVKVKPDSSNNNSTSAAVSSDSVSAAENMIPTTTGGEDIHIAASDNNSSVKKNSPMIAWTNRLNIAMPLHW